MGDAEQPALEVIHSGALGSRVKGLDDGVLQYILAIDRRSRHARAVAVKAWPQRFQTILEFIPVHVSRPTAPARSFVVILPETNKEEGSNFPVVEKEHLNARVIRRKKAAIRPGRLPLRACKRLFDRRKVVEIQRSDPVNIGGSYRRCDRAIADFVFPEARKLLGERHVDFEVVSIKCLDEGVDIPECDRALIAASSRNPREFIQRRGRVLRMAGDKDIAMIHDLLVMPSATVEDATRQLVWGEIARAGEFARTALNTDARIPLEEACVELGIDLADLYAALGSGMEGDDG